MAIRLGENNYGKQRVRILQVSRRLGRHDIKELTLGICLEGDFESAHSKGDNRKILPTDTMKNTVYTLARKNPIASNEIFCLQLIDNFWKNIEGGLPVASGIVHKHDLSGSFGNQGHETVNSAGRDRRRRTGQFPIK